VEITKRNRIIVMTSSGEFVQVPFKKQVYLGQEVTFRQNERISAWQVGAAAVLFLALVSSWNVLIGNLIPGINTPAFLVTLDFNPSIELGVSEAHRVVSAAGLNSDGKALLSRVDVVGEPLDSALVRISRQAESDGYLRPGNNEIIVTIAAQENRDVSYVELKSVRTGGHGKLEQAILAALTQNSAAQVRIWQVPAQVLADAKTAGITPARYLAIRNQAQAIVPERMAARLSASESKERADERPDTEALTASAALGASPTPVLSPLQWTNTAAAATAAAAHTVPDRQAQAFPFSFSNRMKGALSYSE